jgi:hypothetical protein
MHWRELSFEISDQMETCSAQKLATSFAVNVPYALSHRNTLT